MKTYVLVSQGCKIFETINKNEAIHIANIDNNKWLNYVEKCIEEYESYADNEVFVYEVIDGDENNAKLILNASGVVKEDFLS